jgi:hypothetical protein
VSEETEDNPYVIEDIIVFGDEAPVDDAILASKRRRKINEDLMTTTESSPSGRNDDDADVNPSPVPSREVSAPPAAKRPTGFFAEEDGLMLIS